MIYGHSLSGLPEGRWQTLEDHQNGVAASAERFADFGVPATAKLLGKIHDTGKRSDAFQNRLRGKGGKVDHTTAAYLYLLHAWGKGVLENEGRSLAQLLAYPLFGHHGGMPDYGSQAEPGTLKHRISGERIRAVPDWNAQSAEPLPEMGFFLKEIRPFLCLNGNRPDPFAAAFLLRMLHSCLVDADFLDTERFCSPDRHGLRPEPPSISDLEDRLLRYLHAKGFLSDEPVTEDVVFAGAETPCGSVDRREAVSAARRFLLHSCLAAADRDPGIFSLTMPTGGGKTLSSLAFALRHARKHGLHRIILVVPYTSIIEQNAEVFRQALGEEAVLEHHSHYVHPEEEGFEDDKNSSTIYKLVTENWNASIIVTTSVQFFESFFDNRPSRCRKLHNIAKSVVILDEIQMLPVSYVKPCLRMLELLADKYGSSIVLCTATQPALMKSSFLEEGLSHEKVYSIVGDYLLTAIFRIFERARVEHVGVMTDNQLAHYIHSEHQILCIVNSRRHARELFGLLDGGDADFHLSARMTPDHRSGVLESVRQRLAEGLPCRVVSTSLIECGVDISFPVVMREKNGLDVLAQSAGRCNREGRDALGRVISFVSDKPLPKRAADLARRRQAFDAVASREDLFCPESIQAYFHTLYTASRHILDEKNILGMVEIRQGKDHVAWVFQFASMAREFRFIEEDTESVVIEKGEAADLLERFEEYGATSSILRKLQRFSVQVRRYELEQMKRDGRIETKFGFLHILSGGVGYNEKTGLDVALENGMPVEDLLF